MYNSFSNIILPYHDKTVPTQPGGGALSHRGLESNENVDELTMKGARTLLIGPSSSLQYKNIFSKNYLKDKDPLRWRDASRGKFYESMFHLT